MPVVVAGDQVSFVPAGVGMSIGGNEAAFTIVGAVFIGVMAFPHMMLFELPSEGRDIGKLIHRLRLSAESLFCADSAIEAVTVGDCEAAQSVLGNTHVQELN